MGNEFNLAVSLTVIGDGFNRSFNDGFRAIREEAINAFTRAREIQSPETATFGLTYEVKNNRLYWPGDRLSVEHHLRRNIVWLKANGGSEAQLKQARLDLAVFREVQTRALGLSDGQGVMWLAQRTTEASDGVALQQIRRDGDKLIQSSQLLPFDQQSQIDNFIDFLNENREIVSVEDSVGGWIVQGEALNFKQDLPEIIDEVYQAERPLPSLVTTPAVNNINLFEPLAIPAQTENIIETPRPVTTTTGFWFEVMAAAVTMPVVNETSAPEFVAKNTSSSEPEVTEVIAAAKTSTASEPTRIIFVKSESRIPASLRVSSEVRSVKTVFVGKAAERPPVAVKTQEKTPASMIPTGKNNNKSSAAVRKLSLPTAVSKELKRLAPESKPVVFRAAEPPVYEVNEKEIPVWQPKIMAAIGDYTIYILAFFWAILNKNLIRLSVSRGSGWWQRMAVIFPS